MTKADPPKQNIVTEELEPVELKLKVRRLKMALFLHTEQGSTTLADGRKVRVIVPVPNGYAVEVQHRDSSWETYFISAEDFATAVVAHVGAVADEEVKYEAD